MSNSTDSPPPPPPLLSDLGLEDPPRPDSFGKAFHSFDPAKDQASANNPYFHGASPSGRTVNSDLPEHRKYIALTIVRQALLVLAALEVVVWIILVLVIVLGVVFADEKARTGLAAGGVLSLIITFFSGAIVACLLVSVSELIKLAMDIQENTLAAARAAQER